MTGISRAKSNFLERLEDREQYHGDQNQGREFIEPAVEHMAAGVAVGAEVVDQFQAIQVINDQAGDQDEFKRQPRGVEQRLPRIGEQ